MKKVIKKKLEETKQHAFEKKVLQREKAKGAPRVGEFYKENDILLEDIDLGQIRIDMKREGEDITNSEIVEITKIIPVKDHMIEITIYERKDQEGSDQKRNVMLFVHGGGFIGGDVKTKGNQCRYLAQQSGAVVISPEYRLAPETPYPGAEEDVLGTIDWLEENADRFNIDTDKMAIIQEFYEIVLDTEHPAYQRFATHLQYLETEILSKKRPIEDEEDDVEFYERNQKKYPEAYVCSQKIVEHIEQHYNCKLSADEKMYLIIYVKRLILEMGHQS